MDLELIIEEKAYVLSTKQSDQSVELSQMSGGAQRLLPGAGIPTESQLEAAIETAEEWLMPLIKGRHGGVLNVRDTSGRWVSGLSLVRESTSRSWSLTDIEQTFLNVVNLATGRNPPAELDQHRLFVADLLLVRELAHHSKVVSICLPTVEINIENRK